MNGIGKRLRQKRKERRLTLEQVANACGWEGAGRVSNYESGRRPVGVDDLLLLAAALGVTPAWLMTGEGPESTTGNVEQMHHIRADVPVVDFATLADVDLSQGSIPATMASSWIGGPVQYGPRTFAFKMPDSSMATADEETIPKGFYVYVDPEQRAASDGQAVLAKLPAGGHLVARYRQQAGSEWIELPNHPDHLQPKGPFEIVGRVIFSGRAR